jgi:hypothetical protein
MTTQVRTQKPKENGHSPWGWIQSVTTIAEGIWFVDTAGHGGFKLSRKRQRQMPQALRLNGAWYEEDCEAFLVILGFPQCFKKEEVEQAHKSVKNWFPGLYEEWSGKVIPVEESFKKREKLFYETHKEDYIVISAFGDWKEGIPKGMVGVVATKGGIRNASQRYFLVSQEEYHMDFVVDLSRHQEIAKFF